jgi:preprotein translocase subunit SecG
MEILINLLLVLEAFVALLMILVILMQRPKSEGLGAAFGGGVTENIFGAQTTNVLTTITTWLAAIFFLITLVLSILYAHKGTSSSAVRRELMKGQPAATAPAAGTKGASPAATSPKVNAAPSATSAPLQPPSSPKPADAAIGVVPPGSAPLAPSASPAPSTKP